MKFGQNPRYYPHNGEQLISVTSVLTLLAKNALIRWSANITVDYLSNVPFGGDPDDWKKARTAYKQASTEAADYGTYIHTLCKYYFGTGIQITSPHEMTQKLMISFYAWCKKHNVKPIETELVVYGDGYAGRVDLICEIDQFWYKSKDKKDQKIGRRKRVVALIDFKTGKGSYYAEWPLQTAAYRGAYNQNAEQTWQNQHTGRWETFDKGVRPTEHHGVLKFSKETNKVNYKDMSETYKQDLEAFMLLVRFWELMNEA